MTQILYQRVVEGIGELTLQAFCPQNHGELLHSWVTRPYAEYWGMLGASVDEVRDAYQEMLGSGDVDVLLGFHDGEPAFLLESYDVAVEAVAKHYEVADDDRGMHILLAPADRIVAGFSAAVFDTIVGYLFSQPGINRIVVEPDHRNEKIHRLNKRAGFFHSKLIDLGHKQAYLAFCTREQHQASLALRHRERQKSGALHKDPASGAAATLAPEVAVAAIEPDTWRTVNLGLVRKAISELCHERVLVPELAAEAAQPERQGGHLYRICADDDITEYYFRAEHLALNHWVVDARSIERCAEGEPVPLSAMDFILDFKQQLGIDSAQLPTYLEEISSTLCSSAFKLSEPALSARELAVADFQAVETGMTEGHPCFIANNGRIGFDAVDFRSYAPEAGTPVRLIWVAAHKSRAHFACCPDFDYHQLISAELDITTRQRFEQILVEQGLDLDDYVWIPVHPWQWYNKLTVVFSLEIADRKLVCLGYGDDAFLAQQSIRTFYNISQPGKYYVKTALSILNMGFMRGLSALYMRSTPAINDWLAELVAADTTLGDCGFEVLRECASVGYEIPHYSKERVGDSPYRKMLAALWRENPVNRLAPGQRVMTMASLLHVDAQGDALLPALIEASGHTTERWLAHYFDAYFIPLLHCFYRYKLVFMPHGENLILRLENHLPVGVFMKDIGEEICLQNSDIDLPEDVQRIAITMPEEMEVLAIFTDVFDCFFRFMAEILHRSGTMSPNNFWLQVARAVMRYQSAHPEFAEAFERYDLFAEEFALSCLNRLQLRNNQQMVDLADPPSSLAFAGQLENPIAGMRRHIEASDGDNALGLAQTIEA